MEVGTYSPDILLPNRKESSSNKKINAETSTYYEDIPKTYILDDSKTLQKGWDKSIELNDDPVRK